jgi:uncharacterized cofD-like protein
VRTERTDKKVVAIGGGTGLSTMLRGLKLYTKNITAIVTVADDGGSSGKLRSDLGMLPPGDIRNCISALAETEPIMRELLNYRFSDGGLAGHSFGNLFLAAMNGMSKSFDEAVQKVSDVLAVVGRVLPVTNENVTLHAELENGGIIDGESMIGHRGEKTGAIRRVWLAPDKPQPVEDAIWAIIDADIIVLGPGSLYTSIIPNLLVDGIADAIQKSKAVKIYVCNIMSQSGETEGYTAHDHLRAIERHTYDGIVDFVIANNEKIPKSLLERYTEENSYMVPIDEESFTGGTTLVQGNLLLVKDEQIRHNFSRLARAVMLLEKWVYMDRKRTEKRI